MGRRLGPNPSVENLWGAGVRARGGRWRAGVGGVVVALACVLGGCHSGPKNFENENDTLRAQVMDLQDKVTSLEAELGEAKGKINELQEVLAGTGEGPAKEVLEALPRCAGIEIGRLSGPIDKDGEPGYPESIEVYVRPYDGRQRFVQVVGAMTVEVRYLPASAAGGADDETLEAGVKGGSATGVLLGRVRLDPSGLREAYRSGFMGTHYTVAITPPADVRVSDGAIVLSAVLLDRVTGLRHEAWRVVRVGG